MAQRTVIQLTDDLDGEPLDNGDGETVAFGYRGESYEIDLSNEHARALDDLLARYVAAARRTGVASAGARSRRRRSTAAAVESARRDVDPDPVRDVDPKAVRAWAKANGITVNSRGRLGADTLDRYMAANAG